MPPCSFYASAELLRVTERVAAVEAARHLCQYEEDKSGLWAWELINSCASLTLHCIFHCSSWAPARLLCPGGMLCERMTCFLLPRSLTAHVVYLFVHPNPQPDVDPLNPSSSSDTTGKCLTGGGLKSSSGQANINLYLAFLSCYRLFDASLILFNVIQLILLVGLLEALCVHTFIASLAKSPVYFESLARGC